ncbi:hypothetical protein Bca101_026876 [Brassica carinata]
MYDNLLASLGSSNKVVADMNRRRKREEEGADQERIDGLTKNTKQEKNEDNHSSKEEDSEYSETDEENEFSTNGQFSRAASSSTSAYSEHLNQILSGDEVAQSDATYGIKPKLRKHWLQLYKKAGGEDLGSSTRERFFSICNNYMDILHSNKKPFYNGDRREDSSHTDAYLMHSLNHIFRSRDLVKKNDNKISKLSHGETPDNRFWDRGFTSPKVLILLPLRSVAFRVVNRLIQLTPEARRVTVEHHARFNDEFGCEEESDDDGKPSKPQLALGKEEDKKKLRNEEDKTIVVLDHMSAIEVFVMDHADVMYMQNWEHVKTVLKKLNEQSSEHHNTDINRVPPMYFYGLARFYRQSIILSSYLTPGINALFNEHCLNYKEKMRLDVNIKVFFMKCCGVSLRFMKNLMQIP